MTTWVKEGELIQVTLLVRAVRQDEAGGLYYQPVGGGYIAYLRPKLIKGIKKVNERARRRHPGASTPAARGRRRALARFRSLVSAQRPRV